MLERTRKIFKLKVKERCPGEFVCTTDKLKGKIARTNGAETLSSFCNKTKCDLFYTKQGTTPIEFSGLFDAAMVLRETRLDELSDLFKDYETNFPFWAIESYKAAERVFRMVENEMNEPSEDNAEEFLDGGDSGAFASMEKKMKQLKSAEVEKKNEFEISESESMSIFEYLRLNG